MSFYRQTAKEAWSLGEWTTLFFFASGASLLAIGLVYFLPKMNFWAVWMSVLVGIILLETAHGTMYLEAKRSRQEKRSEERKYNG